ncbi:hypothetical protein BU14_0153s0038 [Porphyra umbilicalis]|uniref:Uncharacterized protein n=1 Tax=Porphyra umbilicalis TaxID=2786 RepID=A0A1X6P979_PORUM|nr:hypothetical protein BU14_0153s0038 [Porphyra umbilicalis]|eukprot:OSX77296.1 hypothetical protein BU14_0153s0038 [Porphyra umbilicalis]
MAPVLRAPARSGSAVAAVAAVVAVAAPLAPPQAMPLPGVPLPSDAAAGISTADPASSVAVAAAAAAVPCRLGRAPAHPPGRTPHRAGGIIGVSPPPPPPPPLAAASASRLAGRLPAYVGAFVRAAAGAGAGWLVATASAAMVAAARGNDAAIPGLATVSSGQAPAGPPLTAPPSTGCTRRRSRRWRGAWGARGRPAGRRRVQGPADPAAGGAGEGVSPAAAMVLVPLVGGGGGVDPAPPPPPTNGTTWVPASAARAAATSPGAGSSTTAARKTAAAHRRTGPPTGAARPAVRKAAAASAVPQTTGR